MSRRDEPEHRDYPRPAGLYRTWGTDPTKSPTQQNMKPLAVEKNNRLSRQTKKLREAFPKY